MKRYDGSRRPAVDPALPEDACVVMRKLIRSTASSAFLGPDGDWTKDIAKAISFPDVPSVQKAREAFNLQGVQLYYSFDQLRRTRWDFTLGLK